MPEESTVPSDHRRKNAIRQRVRETGETYRQAAWAIDNPDAVAPLVCICPNPMCEHPDCQPALEICQECDYVFGVSPDDPGNGTCPNGCTDYLRSLMNRQLTGRSRCSTGLYPCSVVSDPSRFVAVKPVGMENPVAVDTRFLKPWPS